jgi:hypothetical protein
MVAKSVIVQRQFEALRKVREVVEKHDPATAEQLRLVTPTGTIPNSIKQPDEVMSFIAHSVAALAELVDQHIEETKPRPRGRPRRAS